MVNSLVRVINSLTEEERNHLVSQLQKGRRFEQRSVDFVNQPFIGMWKDREDLADSSKWVRQLRQNEWKYKHG